MKENLLVWMLLLFFFIVCSFEAIGRATRIQQDNYPCIREISKNADRFDMVMFLSASILIAYLLFQ